MSSMGEVEMQISVPVYDLQPHSWLRVLISPSFLLVEVGSVVGPLEPPVLRVRCY